MAFTSVTFYIRNELIEGDFTVSLKGRIGRIKIELLPKGGSEKVLGFAVSRATVEIPYSIQENEDVSINDRGYTPPPTSPVKREALSYFNRLIDVLRWKTRKFWIRDISEFDISYMEINREDDVGKTTGGFSLDMGNPSFPPYPMNSLDENASRSNINTLLNNETPIHDIQFLDSINHYQTGRFDDAVVTMNIALESFVSVYLARRLRDLGNSDAKPV
jgi:hypothetical protein